MPPRIIWSDNTPVVYFGTLYLNTAPTLNSVSPSTAPFQSNPFDITITGANFGASGVDYGGGTKVSVLWKGGSQSNLAFQAISVTSTTYVNGTSIRATMAISSSPSNNVGLFDTNQSTSNPQFQFQITNPDGQQTVVSSNTLSILTPTLTVPTAVSATGNSLGLQAASDIILNGTSFDGWNVNVSTGRPSVSLSGGGRDRHVRDFRQSDPGQCQPHHHDQCSGGIPNDHVD